MEAPVHLPHPCTSSHGVSCVLFPAFPSFTVWLAKEGLGKSWIRCRKGVPTEGVMDVYQVHDLFFTNTESKEYGH